MRRRGPVRGVASGALTGLLLVGALGCATGGKVSDDAGTPQVEAGGDTGAPVDAAADAPASDAAADGGTEDAAVDADAGSGLARLQLNEIAPNVSSNVDLVELLVVAAGKTTGITLEQDITSGVLILATLPDLPVAKGDFIVVHLKPPAGVTDETTSQTDCTNANCYDTGWDVRGGAGGITYSGRVLVLRDFNNGPIQDGAAFYRSNATSPAGFFNEVMALQVATQWLPADCGGNACNTNPLAEGVSADWAGCGSGPAGKTVARVAGADTDGAGDWAVGTNSIALTNP